MIWEEEGYMSKKMVSAGKKSIHLHYMGVRFARAQKTGCVRRVHHAIGCLLL